MSSKQELREILATARGRLAGLLTEDSTNPHVVAAIEATRETIALTEAALRGVAS
jgi:hypothetical protein